MLLVDIRDELRDLCALLRGGAEVKSTVTVMDEPPNLVETAVAVEPPKAPGPVAKSPAKKAAPKRKPPTKKRRPTTKRKPLA
jgi:hypothetical protein